MMGGTLPSLCCLAEKCLDKSGNCPGRAISMESFDFARPINPCPRPSEIAFVGSAIISPGCRKSQPTGHYFGRHHLSVHGRHWSEPVRYSYRLSKRYLYRGGPP